MKSEWLLQIKDYNLTLDYRFNQPDLGDEPTMYEPIWDNIVGHPDHPWIWKAQKRGLLAMVESAIEGGNMPIVAVFVPKKSKVPRLNKRSKKDKSSL